MKVRDLIAALSEHDQNAEVMFRHPSHDYWRNELASEVDGVERALVTWSDYHSQNKVVDTDDERKRERCKRVILIG